MVGRVSVCTPLICSESSLHHVFAYNFLRLQFAYNFLRLQIAYNVQVRQQQLDYNFARLGFLETPHTDFATTAR